MLLELTRPISFGLWRTDGEFWGIEKSVAVTDGDGLIFHYRAGLYCISHLANADVSALTQLLLKWFLCLHQVGLAGGGLAFSIGLYVHLSLLLPPFCHI